MEKKFDELSEEDLENVTGGGVCKAVMNFIRNKANGNGGAISGTDTKPVGANSGKSGGGTLKA